MMQEQETKDTDSKDASIKLKQIAKIIFLMISFRLVMDSDMWIVLCFLILIMIYVLPVYFLKHLKSGLLQTMLDDAVSKAQGFAHRWYEQNVQQQPKPKEQSKVHFMIAAEPVVQEDSEEDSLELWDVPEPPTEETNFNDLAEDHLDDIWHVNDEEQ